MRPLAYVFDVPAQQLRASDRVLKCSEPTLMGRTVLYVRSSRPGPVAPVPYTPVSVITAPLERDNAELEEPIGVAWGTRVIVERIPDPGDAYHVSALEPLPPDARLELQALAALQITRDRYPDAFGAGDAPAAGAVIASLLGDRAPTSSVFQDALEDGEMIEAWWYVDGHRVETPSEASARDAADLFADHLVRLRIAGADAGETCQRCGGVITWTEHLPPLRRGEPARCNARLQAVR